MFQNATQNSLELLDDPKAAAVDEIAAKLGLCKVVLGSGFWVPLDQCFSDSGWSFSFSSGELIRDEGIWVTELPSGLQVGWIFTDLLSEDTRIGTVRYSRNQVRLQLAELHLSGCSPVVNPPPLAGLALPERRGVHHSGLLPEPAPQLLQALSGRVLRLQVRHGGGNRWVGAASVVMASGVLGCSG